MKINDNLSNIFDIELPVKREVASEIIEPETEEDSNKRKIESDYDKTRKNLDELLSKGQEALNHALEVAKASEHPRAFEVVGNLMKQLADVNQQLMDIHKQKQKLDQSDTKSAPIHSTNNAIFVGSTSELSKMIQNMSRGE